MRYKEEIRDLFEVNEDLYGSEPYCYAHCISADFGMFGGVVVGFNERWNMKNVLISRHINVQDTFRQTKGMVIPVEVKDCGIPTTVYNLITKETVGNLPSYESLKKSLTLLKEQMIEDGNTKLAIPKIGCGIDRLDWGIVSDIIKDIFSDTDINILVCMK